MQAIWDRIETWRKLHVLQKRTSFQPGATNHEIYQVEVTMKVKLPDDVKVSYRFHNGNDNQNLIGDLQFYNLWVLNSLEEILYHRSIVVERRSLCGR